MPFSGDLPDPGMEPGPPALGARNLSHWTAREVMLTCSCCKIGRLRKASRSEKEICRRFNTDTFELLFTNLRTF